MVCLGCLESKYFSLDLIFGLGKNATEPSGSLHVVEYTYIYNHTYIHVCSVRSTCRRYI